MRKIIIIMVLLIFALCGCDSGGGSSGGNSGGGSSGGGESAEANTPPTEEDSNAVSIELNDTQENTQDIGEYFVTEINISGVNNEKNPPLGAFSFFLEYNSATVKPVSAEYGYGLGDPDLSKEEIDVYHNIEFPGRLRVFSVSFLTREKIASIQPNNFILTDITFEVISEGKDDIVASNFVLSDVDGNKISMD